MAAHMGGFSAFWAGYPHPPISRKLTRERGAVSSERFVEIRSPLPLRSGPGLGRAGAARRGSPPGPGSVPPARGSPPGVRPPGVRRRGSSAPGGPPRLGSSAPGGPPRPGVRRRGPPARGPPARGRPPRVCRARGRFFSPGAAGGRAGRAVGAYRACSRSRFSEPPRGRFCAPGAGCERHLPNRAAGAFFWWFSTRVGARTGPKTGLFHRCKSRRPE